MNININKLNSSYSNLDIDSPIEINFNDTFNVLTYKKWKDL